LILSEFPLGVKPDRYTFPKRNRIVSGLAHGVVIVEAAEQSGTLITARLALEQNRELMVVPGSALSKQYAGSHRLIQEGAALVSSTEDVLALLGTELARYLSPKNTVLSRGSAGKSSTLENLLLPHIGPDSTTVDDIILGSGLTSAEVSSILLGLELEGVVAIASDGGYVNLS